MVVQFKLELQWWQAISRALEVAAEWIKDYAEFFEEALTLVEDSVDQAYETWWQSTWLWKWKDLDERTKIARQKRYWHYKNSPSNPKILRWTWAMQDSKNKVITDMMASLEYTDPKAKYHQFWFGVPARPFLVLNPKLSAEITRALQKHIDNVLGIANLR